MKKAVITTDIIQSSGISHEGRSLLNQKIEDLMVWLNKNSFINVIDFNTFRGDSFQCILEKPKMGLKTALLIKTAIKSWNPSETSVLIKKNEHIKGHSIIKMFDVRVSLGIGRVEMETGKVGTSDGEAFHLSGKRLDMMKKEKRNFCISTNDLYKEELEIESFLLETILAKTSAFQCKVLQYKIEGQTELWIAQKLGIHQSAVNQRATAGSWHAIDKMIQRFETMYHD